MRVMRVMVPAQSVHVSTPPARGRDWQDRSHRSHRSQVLTAAARPTPGDLAAGALGARRGAASGDCPEPARGSALHNGPKVDRTLREPLPTSARTPGASVAMPFCNAVSEGAE